MKVKRYNLGFWKFGPLEQCNDGQLVKYTDYAILNGVEEAAFWVVRKFIEVEE